MERTLQVIQNRLTKKIQPVSETAALDAQVLLAHILAKPRSWILAHPEYLINDEQYQAVQGVQERILHGEPLPYVIGHWEFYSLDFDLTPDVLIPRPETELLVEKSLSWLQKNPHKRRVIDVGTGSGCIGISIARHVSDVQLVLVDISTKALDIARKNLARYSLLESVEVFQSSLLDSIPAVYSFDLICANLPYISSGILDTLPVAKQEPRLALDGGMDGLELIEKLIVQADKRMEAGGLILLEIDPSQCSQVFQMAHRLLPGSQTHSSKDLSGKDRCVEIELPYMIYHLCQRADWQQSLPKGYYEAESLDDEGFIHCSLQNQIVEVVNRYYQGVLDMVVLAIDPHKLISDIRWERSGEQYYPHVYGPINLDAICSVEAISTGS